MNTYSVSEIFSSIQGEGSEAGRPMIFIRFAGCNLSCSFCDTNHEENEFMTVPDILRRIRGLDPFKRFPVVLTGGEPSLQVDSEIVRGLSQTEIHLETNGTRCLAPEVLAAFRVITISPKSSEGEENWGRCRASQHSRHSQFFNLKIVMDPEGGWKGLMDIWKTKLPWFRLYLQPCDIGGRNNVEEVLAFIRENPEWTLSLQLHKILGIR